MAEIYIVSVNEKMNETMWRNILQIVSYGRREQSKNFIFEKDAKRSLVGELIIRYLVIKKLGIKNKKIFLKKNKYGKPYIGNFSDYSFNISHSGDYVVCGWSKDEIGIDIEFVSEIDLDIAKRFFTKNEYKYLCNKDKSVQNRSFFDLWTLKESYIKYKGKGLSIPLDSFEFRIDSDDIKFYSKDIYKPNFFKFDIDKDYKLALCMADTEISAIKNYTIEKLLDGIMQNNELITF